MGTPCILQILNEIGDVKGLKGQQLFRNPIANNKEEIYRYHSITYRLSNRFGYIPFKQ